MLRTASIALCILVSLPACHRNVSLDTGEPDADTDSDSDSDTDVDSDTDSDSDTDVECPWICNDGCEDGVCYISEPPGDIACPAGWSCDITCSTGAEECQREIDCQQAESCTFNCVAPWACYLTCEGGPCNVNCPAEFSCSKALCFNEDELCTIDCSGPDSCEGEVLCEVGPCDVSCTGTASCYSGAICGNSCACDVVYSGGTCDYINCPEGCYGDPHGCCTSEPEGCDTCP
jgi:hypothetical protein